MGRVWREERKRGNDVIIISNYNCTSPIGILSSYGLCYSLSFSIVRNLLSLCVDGFYSGLYQNYSVRI